MDSIEQSKKELQSLVDKSSFEKMLSIVSIITKLTKEINLIPIVVGGLAVEIYTRSEYTTMDIDIIFSRIDIMNKLLRDLGFTKHGRHFYHEELGVSIEIPDDMLEDADPNRVIELELDSGNPVYVIGIEDIIISRLRACVHWKSTSDCEWGKNMFITHFVHLDIDYMKKCLTHKDEKKVFSEWMKVIQ